MNFSKDFLYLSSVLKSYRTFASLIKGVSATAVVLGFGLGLSACSSDDKVAGGGPSGTEAGNAITAQILTSDATPAARAIVKVIAQESLEGTSGAYTGTADENGKVVIEGVEDGAYILEAKQGGNAIQMQVSVSNSDVDLGSGTLERMASVSGTVNADGTIKVRGLDYSAPVVDGQFTLDSLPAGHLDLVFIPKAEDSDSASSYVLADAGKKTTTGSFANESTSLLLDDFEDGNNQHRFAPMYFGPSEGGWWYVSHGESVIITTGTKIHNSANGTDEFLTVSKDEDGNKLIHIATDNETLDSLNYDSTHTQVNWPWANMGVAIGSNDKTICYDLTSADSIVFMAKGSGNIDFVLVDETRLSETFDGKIGRSNFTLSDQWQRYSIPLAVIVDERAGSLNCVTLLSWEFLSQVDIWLDNVELVGASRQSIWKNSLWNN